MKKKDFEKERYRFILEKIQFLDQSTYKLLALFQSLTCAVIGAAVTVLITWKSLSLTAKTAQMAILSLFYLFSLLVIFVIASMVAVMCSWYDYRKEEVELINKSVQEDIRASPSKGNLWRWTETWFIALVLAVWGIIAYLTFYEMLPLVN